MEAQGRVPEGPSSSCLVSLPGGCPLGHCFRPPSRPTLASGGLTGGRDEQHQGQNSKYESRSFPPASTYSVPARVVVWSPRGEAGKQDLGGGPNATPRRTGNR